MSKSTTTLYHYTSLPGLRRIVNDGFLRPTESNISPRREHAGPDVVWFTTHSTPDSGHGLDGAAYDKRRIRITVRVPKRDVHKWIDWARSHGISDRWLAAMVAVGGAHSWMITTRAVPESEWLEIRDTVNHQVLWVPGEEKAE